MAHRCAVCGTTAQVERPVQGWSGAVRKLCESSDLVPHREYGSVHRDCRRKVERTARAPQENKNEPAKVCGKRTRGQRSRVPTSQLKTPLAKRARNKEVDHISGGDVIEQTAVYFEQHPDQLPALLKRLGIDPPPSRPPPAPPPPPPPPPSNVVDRAAAVQQRIGLSTRDYGLVHLVCPNTFLL